MNFTQNLKKILKEKKISQVKFLKDMEYNRNQLVMWNKRDHIPSALIAYNIAAYLNCRIEDLLDLPYLK